VQKGAATRHAGQQQFIIARSCWQRFGPEARHHNHKASPLTISLDDLKSAII
jgi:hypothetical protein